MHAQSAPALGMDQLARVCGAALGHLHYEAEPANCLVAWAARLRVRWRRAVWVLLAALCLPLASTAGSYEDFFRAVAADDDQLVRQLLLRGFDVNVPDPAGQRALYLALREPALKVARLLIDWERTQIDARNAYDETPMMMAALKGHTELVQRLLARGADVNKPGWTALHYAATGGHNAILRLLLESHAYIDAASPNGTTPLMMAAQYGTPSAVKLLLEEGADPTLVNDVGWTAHDFAMRSPHKDSAALIAAFVGAWQERYKTATSAGR